MTKSCATHGYTTSDYAALGWTSGWPPGGDLPSSGGLVVAPLELGMSYYIWSLSPVQPGPTPRWVFTMDAEMVDEPVIGVNPILAGTSHDTDSSIISRYWNEPLDITTRQTYTWTQPPGNYSRAYTIDAIGLQSTGQVFPSRGFLRIYSFCVKPEGETDVTTASPLRQSGRTDGLIGAPRQGPAALASQIRQGRSLVR